MRLVSEVVEKAGGVLPGIMVRKVERELQFSRINGMWNDLKYLIAKKKTGKHS